MSLTGLAAKTVHTVRPDNLGIGVQFQKFSRIHTFYTRPMASANQTSKTTQTSRVVGVYVQVHKEQ